MLSQHVVSQPLHQGAPVDSELLQLRLSRGVYYGNHCTEAGPSVNHCSEAGPPFNSKHTLAKGVYATTPKHTQAWGVYATISVTFFWEIHFLPARNKLCERRRLGGGGQVMRHRMTAPRQARHC